MNYPFVVLLDLVLMILSCVNQCSAIYCYVCSSTTLAACGDEFSISPSDGKLRFWCDGGSCVKRRGTRVDGSVRRVEIMRGCIVRRSENCYSEFYNNLDTKACSCNTDFCNGSPQNKQRKSILLFFTSVFFSLFLAHKSYS
uniref:Protein quiver n=1 Tax=Biomphalaria glabrata TaxID=6526 RepID=A0A2C9L9B8_BIOGL